MGRVYVGDVMQILFQKSLIKIVKMHAKNTICCFFINLYNLELNQLWCVDHNLCFLNTTTGQPDSDQAIAQRVKTFWRKAPVYDFE